METRLRSRRAQVDPSPSQSPEPEPGRATRSRSRPQAGTPEGSQRSARQSVSAQTPFNAVLPRKGLAADPIPRRGAPRYSGVAPSIASIATSLPRNEDVTDFGDDDSRYSQEFVPQSEPSVRDVAALEAAEEALQAQAQAQAQDHQPTSQEEPVPPPHEMYAVHDEDLRARVEMEVPLDEKSRREIMILSLPDLAKAADGLFELIKTRGFNYDSPVFRALFRIKNNTLSAVREIFQDEENGPFLDWNMVVGEETTEEQAGLAISTIIQANIATALVEICYVQAGVQLDANPLFGNLYNLFPNFFAIADDLLVDPELTLEIRTVYLIEATILLGLKEKTDFYKYIAQTFCEPKKAKFFHRFSHGPFKPLWNGPHVDEHDVLSSKRIVDIISGLTNDRQTLFGLLELRPKYSFLKLLEDLKTWFLRMYTAVRDLTDGRPVAEPGLFVEDGEDFRESQTDMGDSQTDISESQPIVRLGDNMPSLFQGEASILALHRAARSYTPTPPSNQEQSEAPQDYPDQSNGELLDETPPPSRTVQANGRLSQVARGKRPAEPESAAEEEEEEEEEEDEFETDIRPVDEGKRAAIASSMPPPKRSKMGPPEIPHRQPLPSSAASSRSPPPSQDRITALRTAKGAIAHRHRLASIATPPSFKQRHTWSDADAMTLQALIRENHASWAAIELQNERFEHPRNQQAYRDKARNMKVDYLMTDAILPPCFDLVALGKKEVDRLVSLGKNPWRKEKDVDIDGNAIGTEFRR